MKAIMQLSNADQQRVSKRIRQQCATELEKYDLNLDTLMVYTLHNEFGFGEQRINKFFETMGKLRKELKAHYSADGDERDDSFYTAMREQLERDGISMNKIERKIEEMV